MILKQEFRHKPVRCLPYDTQQMIMSDIQKRLMEDGYRVYAIKSLIEDAMSSKVCDLEDTIKITYM